MSLVWAISIKKRNGRDEVQARVIKRKSKDKIAREGN